MTKRKRTHRPLVNPIEWAIAGAQPTPKALLDLVALREWTAVDAITRGHGDAEHWRTLADAINVVETLVQKGFSARGLEEARQTAVSAMVEIQERWKRIGKMGFTGAQKAAIVAVLEWHSAQRSAIPRREYENALKRTADRIVSSPKAVKVAV